MGANPDVVATIGGQVPGPVVTGTRSGLGGDGKPGTGPVSRAGICPIPHRTRAGLSQSDWGLWFTGHSWATSVPARAQPGERHPLKLHITLTAVRKQDPASRAAGSSPRRDTGGGGMACFLLAGGGSTTAPVVDDHCAGGGQGGHGRPEVVAGQQEIHRMRAIRGGRDKDPHYRPGGAAAGAITQSGRPGPVSLIIGRRSGSLVAGGPPGGLGSAARKPHRHSTSVRQPRAVSVGT
jgi:hypothetical protein